MIKLLLLILIILLSSCELTNNYSGTCLIEQTNGREQVWSNVLSIDRQGNRTHIKVAEIVSLDYAIVQEYITFNVKSITCS